MKLRLVNRSGGVVYPNQASIGCTNYNETSVALMTPFMLRWVKLSFKGHRISADKDRRSSGASKKKLP